MLQYGYNKTVTGKIHFFFYCKFNKNFMHFLENGTERVYIPLNYIFGYKNKKKNYNIKHKKMQHLPAKKH